MPTYVAITRSDGHVECMEFYTEGRFPTPPKVGGWMRDGSRFGWWREGSDQNIEGEIARRKHIYERDGVTVIGWRRLSAAEHAMFTAERPGAGSVYRGALVDRGGRIEYDLSRARDCCRNEIRRQRAAVMQRLDGEFMRALGQGNKAEQDAVEAERQKWRDAPADAKIEAAQSVGALKQIKVV